MNIKYPMDWSNWINLGLLLATGLVGILTWYGASRSAREALDAQNQANVAAARSAAAAEDAAKYQHRMMEIENQRHEESAIDAKRAILHAKITTKPAFRFNRSESDTFLTIVNSGKSTAKNLKVTINQKPMNEYGECATKLPTDATIGPNGHIDFMLIYFLSGELHPPFNVSLTWDDDSAFPGEWLGAVS